MKSIQIILTAATLLSLVANADVATDSTSAEFEIRGNKISVDIPIDGVAITDRSDPIFVAFTSVSPPGVRDLAVFLDRGSYQSLQQGRSDGVSLYVMMGVQVETIGRTTPAQFNQVRSDFRGKGSMDAPELTGSAASTGIQVVEFNNLGVVRDDANSIAIVNFTKYADSSGEIVQEVTGGTMLARLNGSVVNVAVIKQEASQDTAEKVERIISGIRFSDSD